MADFVSKQKNIYLSMKITSIFIFFENEQFYYDIVDAVNFYTKVAKLILTCLLSIRKFK